MTSKWSSAPPGAQNVLNHGLGFVFSGALAFLVDAAVLKLLTLGLGLHPVVARLAAISAAMVTAWLAHRRFTFRMATPPTFPEFLRYAAVGWAAATINYGVFAAIILARPGLEPLYALLASSLVAMVFSYLGMRFAAFRQPGPLP